GGSPPISDWSIAYEGSAFALFAARPKKLTIRSLRARTPRARGPAEEPIAQLQSLTRVRNGCVLRDFHSFGRSGRRGSDGASRCAGDREQVRCGGRGGRPAHAGG